MKTARTDVFYDDAPISSSNALTCPRCGSPTNVRDSRPRVTNGFTIVQRRRRCVSCEHGYNTVEISLDEYHRLRDAAFRFSRFQEGLEKFIGEADGLLDQLHRVKG